MNEQETIEKIAAFIFSPAISIKRFREVDHETWVYFMDRAERLVKLIKSLGFVRHKVEWKDKPDSEELWFGSYSGGRADFLADILFKNSEEGFYKIIGTFCDDSFYSEHTDDAFYKSLNDKTCKNYKWTKAQVPEAPKEGE
jgi:hypothetical protein